jgi:LysM repeat protein
MIYEMIFVGVSFFHPHAQLDSLGTETVNGKIFVIHKVDEKETLYSIARRYGATVDGIMQSNPGMSRTLEIGQIVKVPYTKVASTVPTSTAGAKVHTVQTKETMYSISKIYGVSVEDIRRWNNLSDNAISVGQELVVKKPTSSSTSSTTVSSPVTAPKVSEATKPGQTHTVAAQETLYSVARQYSISVQQVKEWNNLTDNAISVGQVIYVGPPDGKAANTTMAQVKPTTPATEPASTVKTTVVDPPKQTAIETAKTEPVASTQPKTQTQPQTIRISESVKSSDEVIESGMAELIEGTEGNRKYLALHRTAPVGTILKVKNEMNNREVFVRVMGKLQDSPQNGKLVIKLSRSAYDRLGAIDPKFRVELTYYK